MITKKIKKNKRLKKAQMKKVGQSILTFFVVFNFIFSQSLLPYAVAQAQEVDASVVEEQLVEEEDETKDAQEAKEEMAEVLKVVADENEVEEEVEEEEVLPTEEAETTTEGDIAEEEALDPNTEEVGNQEIVEELGNQETEETEQVLAEDADGKTASPEDENSQQADVVEVENNNDAKVSNEVTSVSNTGDNTANENGEEASPILEEGIELTNPEVSLIEETNPQSSANEELKTNEEGNNEETLPTEEEILASEIELQQAPELLSELGVVENTPTPTETPEVTTAEIATGEATAIANIFNEINTNIYGEQWLESIINIYDVYQGDINLLELFNNFFQPAVDAGQEVAETSPEETDETDENDSSEEVGQTITIENTNNANVENIALADANTGGNEASGNAGDVEITTGDALSMANVVNLINLNIFGENWIFVVINVFGNWAGDLIVPGNDLLSLPGSTQFSDVEISNTNTATIENNVEAVSNTGDNEANDNDGAQASIVTGSAVSASEVVNLVNTNIVGSNWFSLSVNNFGGWLGGVNNWFGEEGSYAYDFDAGDATNSPDKLSITNINMASIMNTVLAYANTGGNKANENGGGVNMETGNAFSVANAMNLVNTNIVGNNWIFGIVNVFGAWEGDVEFAYPDLAINIEDGKSSAWAGEELSYRITVANNGQADAENAAVSFVLNDKASYASSSGGMHVNGGQYSWDVGDLPVGGSTSFLVSARIVDPLEAESDVEATAQVGTSTTEKEISNNVDSDTTRANNKEAEEGEELVYSSTADEESDQDDSLDVSRQKTITSAVKSGDVVYNAIVVENDGETPLYDVRVKDRLMTSFGAEVISFEWPIGDLDVDEAILVEYQLLINGGANPGQYNFEAKGKANNSSDDEVRSDKATIAMNILGTANFDGGYLSQAGEEPFTLIPAAQATGLDNFVLGASDALFTCNGIPLWIWFAALSAYGLAVNWALFPFGKGSKSAGKARTVILPIVATLGAIVFWWVYRCDQMMWFLVGVLLILFLHLVIKQKLHEHALGVAQRTKTA